MLTHTIVTAFTLLAPAALAGQAPAPIPRADLQKPWTVRIDGGLMELHNSGDWGPLLGLRFGRYFDRSHTVGLVLGLTAAAMDAGYASLQLGLDLRIPVHPDVRPTVSGRGGVMLEDGFVGDVLEGSAGVAVRVGGVRWLRLEGQVGRHSDSSGPRGFLIAFEQPL